MCTNILQSKPNIYIQNIHILQMHLGTSKRTIFTTSGGFLWNLSPVSQ